MTPCGELEGLQAWQSSLQSIASDVALNARFTLQIRHALALKLDIAKSLLSIDRLWALLCSPQRTQKVRVDHAYVQEGPADVTLSMHSHRGGNTVLISIYMRYQDCSRVFEKVSHKQI